MLSRRTIRCFTLLALAAGAAALAPYAADEVQEALIEHAMTKGGYVIYLRHASRFSGPRERLGPDSPLDAFADCNRQRNLTNAGRREAVHIGEAFQSFGVPIGAVYALPLCRTRETAELAFGHAALQARLYDAGFVTHMLAVPPAPGTNTVLVDTEDQVRRVAGVALAPGEAAVFQPDGKGGFRYDGMLDQADLIR